MTKLNTFDLSLVQNLLHKEQLGGFVALKVRKAVKTIRKMNAKF